MILGSFTFVASDHLLSVINRIRSCTERDDLFQPVMHSGFAGGYYLHPNLPLKSNDMYYSDVQNDMLVLLSGYVYNKHELIPYFDISHPVCDPELIG